MRSNAKQYSQALMAISREGNREEIAAAVTRLEQLLPHHEKRRVLQQILAEVLSAQEEKQGLVRMKLFLSPRSASSAPVFVDSLSQAMQTPVAIEMVYDDMIIAGVRVIVNNEWYVDATLNHRLVALSRALHV